VRSAPPAIARKPNARRPGYLEWKKRAIALGDADIAAGRTMGTAQVFSAIEKRRTNRIQKR
jgi:hypothetical protein